MSSKPIPEKPKENSLQYEFRVAWAKVDKIKEQK